MLGNHCTTASPGCTWLANELVWRCMSGKLGLLKTAAGHLLISAEGLTQDPLCTVYCSSHLGHYVSPECCFFWIH